MFRKQLANWLQNKIHLRMSKYQGSQREQDAALTISPRRLLSRDGVSLGTIEDLSQEQRVPESNKYNAGEFTISMPLETNCTNLNSPIQKAE